MGKIRKLTEVRADLQAIEEEIAALKAKADADGLTDEETARLAELVAQHEQLKKDELVSASAERYEDNKSKDEEVQRALPQYVPAPKTEAHKLGAVFGSWANFAMPDADKVSCAAKCRSKGVEPSSNFLVVPMDYKKMNFKNRTILSTGGTGSGAEWDYKTYSDLVFQHLTHETPILGFLKTENLTNGRERFYYDYDDTALIATDITASSGTEVNPTIPETNIVSGKQSILCKPITSGYQKVTHVLLEDAPFSLEEKISAASDKALARKMARDCFLATGDGVTDVEGILSLVTELDDVAEWGLEELEELWDAMPSYYRDECIFASNATTKGDVRRKLKDTTGRSFFDKTVIANQNFDTLFGNVWVEDKNIPNNQVLFINPNHYTVAVVDKKIFQRFDEKFFSHVAWAGIMRFGAARTGSEDAFLSLSLDVS